MNLKEFKSSLFSSSTAVVLTITVLGTVVGGLILAKITSFTKDITYGEGLIKILTFGLPVWLLLSLAVIGLIIVFWQGNKREKQILETKIDGVTFKTLFDSLSKRMIEIPSELKKKNDQYNSRSVLRLLLLYRYSFDQGISVPVSVDDEVYDFREPTEIAKEKLLWRIYQDLSIYKLASYDEKKETAYLTENGKQFIRLALQLFDLRTSKKADVPEPK